MTTPGWCETLGIEPPRLEAVKDHREANTYALLLVALLERGEPLTLVEVAERFAQAGVADAERALQALKRCQPARAPVYRVEDRYHLDPHDDELDLWAFRLGLRPPRMPRLSIVRPEPPPLPGPEVRLTSAELDEAWQDASLSQWSAQRLALAVLDVRGGPLTPAAVVAAVDARTRYHRLREEQVAFGRRGSALQVQGDGCWAVAAEAGEALGTTRQAVRDLIEKARHRASERHDPVLLEASRKASERRRATHGAELARLSRGLLVGFPASRPQAVALLDVGRHELATFVGAELAQLPERLAAFDVLGALDVRALLRALGFEPGERRLAELGPPQKSMRLNGRGRTLRITAALLVQGSCGISRPFGEVKRLAAYLASGQLPKLRRRLESDVKSLHALYAYGRLHGCVRLRWGFLDERIPVPWAYPDEPKLYELMRMALKASTLLEVVVGSSPGWSDPWARVRRVRVQQGRTEWNLWLEDERGAIEDDDVQLARLAPDAG